MSDSTEIKVVDNERGTLADLRTGMEVEARFDPVTGVALRIELKR